MEDWQASLDRTLANPPDGRESKFKCERCGDPFEPGDRYYEIEGEILCHECAQVWLEDMWHFADESMCYGEDV